MRKPCSLIPDEPCSLILEEYEHANESLHSLCMKLQSHEERLRTLEGQLLKMAGEATGDREGDNSGRRKLGHPEHGKQGMDEANMNEEAEGAIQNVGEAAEISDAPEYELSSRESVWSLYCKCLSASSADPE